MLDRLNEEGIAAKLGAHFVKRRVGFEQLRAADGGDVGMRDEIQMLQAHPLDCGEIRLECRQQEAGRFEREAKFVAAFKRDQGIERRKEGPSVTPVLRDQSVLGEPRQDTRQRDPVDAVAARDFALRHGIRNNVVKAVANQPLVEFLVGRRRNLDLDAMQ